ncbi:MAG TPA: 16S rRNA (cytosine(1402)-N(4))-methyltransferase RsmH [Candidatus Saccharimonadales bacterium]|nr:16S rRNA (cytosine(1402)-N(4))-methyltransferase RsmH [Candidatus Saccharimonadales bacterium]
MPKNQQQNGELIHRPVLVQEVLECLRPRAGESYLDLTAGYGGHAELIIDKTKSPEKAYLVDRDELAISTLKTKFEKAQIIHSDFKRACEDLVEQGKHFSMVLADLGISSPHLDIASRGFSFGNSGPLDMRMDQSQDLTAAELVNTASEQELIRILEEYGEEPKARVIARRITENRPIEDTTALSNVVAKAYGPWAARSRVNPATRTFQALRIAVNDELNQLSDSLSLMARLLAPGGRLAIISFHSLEDRIVKQYFAEHAGDRFDAELKLLTKKPITAADPEIRLNPRARSAKLRAVAK